MKKIINYFSDLDEFDYIAIYIILFAIFIFVDIVAHNV